MNDLFALKAISKSTIEKKRRKNNENDKDAFYQIWFERDVLMSLHHPLLPSLRGLVETEKVVGFLMDWCIGGDLGSLRRRQMERIFSEEYIRLIFDKRKNLNLHWTSDQSTVAIKKSFEKFDDVLQPGCHCLPWVFGQQVVGYLSLRVQQLDVRCETKTKDSKDENLLRENLYNVVILVDSSFLNPGMNVDQCYDFMRCIAFRRLMVTHDAIRIARRSNYLLLQYLNFMGNEFGHPNKVEFPMPSNNHSFTFANRQWSLLMDKGVHNSLFNFNKDMRSWMKWN